MRKFRVYLMVFSALLFLSFLAIGSLLLFNRRDRLDFELEKTKWESQEAEYLDRLQALGEEKAALQEELEAKIEPAAAQADPEQGTEPEQQPEQEVSPFIRNLDDFAAGDLLYEEEIDWLVLSRYFSSYDIVEGDAVYQRIYGNSYRENENIGLGQLSYLKLLHYNFRGEIQVGELIVNKELAADVLAIFQELFLQKYEIQSMYLIDDFWTGDGNDSDFASIEANNTSAFNYRTVSGGESLSNHAYGRAIDINPQQNPYVWYDGNGNPVWSHANADPYIDRGSGREHVITHNDPCYQIFAKYGFSWGGDWSSPKDYQHFEKEF